jgi:hypothetical protein
MTASPKAIKQFIAVVELYFPRPKFDGDETQEAAWMAIMARVLSPFDDDVVADGAVRLVSSYEGRFFPKPAECTKACQKAQEVKRLSQPQLLIGKQEISYPDRTKLARDIMQAPLGQQAKREGWDTAMFHFIVDHQRAPQGQEIEGCKAKSREFNATYQQLLKPGSHPDAGPLARLAEGIVRKARDTMKGKAA